MEPEDSGWRAELKRVIVEALLVGALGVGVGLLANRVSPRGLVLTRDYFPQAAQVPADSGVRRHGGLPADQSEVGNPKSEVDLTRARLEGKGLEAIDLRGALERFRDPEYQRERIVFVDARNDRSYREGHVPGAYPFDRFHPERYLSELLPACANARSVVIYCDGGDCEESEFAALALVEAGVPGANLLIFAGGWTEWSANGLLVEVGERNSGDWRGVADIPADLSENEGVR